MISIQMVVFGRDVREGWFIVGLFPKIHITSLVNLNVNINQILELD